MTARRPLRIALLAVGALLLVVAVVYFAVPANHLPSFMGHIPASLPGSGVHRLKRAIAALVIGLACLLVAWWLGRRTPRESG